MTVLNQSLSQVLVLAAIAGMRSMAAPALVTHFLARQPTTANFPAHYLQSPTTARWAKVLAVGEIMGDKLPGVPDRISFPALIARAASGALVGAALCQANGEPAAKGACLGGLTAVASAYGSYYLRRALGQWTGLADPIWGALEDAWVIKSGLRALKAPALAQ